MTTTLYFMVTIEWIPQPQKKWEYCRVIKCKYICEGLYLVYVRFELIIQP